MGKHEAKKNTRPVRDRIEEEPTYSTADVTPEETEYSSGKGRTAAIVLVAVAVVLVAVMVAVVIFWQNTASVTEEMFEQRQSQVDIALAAVATPTPEPEKLTDDSVMGDFVDSDGNAWNFRDDLVTVLIMGIDYMANEEHQTGDFTNYGNADMLALAVLDPTNNEMSLLYIPRDTMANIVELTPDGGFFRTFYNNISVAHEYGNSEELGCEITVRSVSDLLAGAPIDRYVAVDYDAIGVIDSLVGGVSVTMDDDYTEFDSDFKEGATVVLTGEQLKTFVTARDKVELDGAFLRGHRQMLFLNAVFQQCKEATKQDVSFPIRLFTKGAEYITTDLSVNEVTTLARAVFKTGFDAENVITLAGEVGVNEVYSEFAGYYPDQEWIEQYLIEYLCEPAK